MLRYSPVADVANAVLATLEEPTDLVMRGMPTIPSRVDEVAEPRCYLYRTNAGAVGRVMTSIKAGKKPYLIGGGDDVVRWCQAALARNAQGEGVWELDPQATQWCAVGAIMKAVAESGLSGEVAVGDVILSASDSLPGGLVAWNNATSRTADHVAAHFRAVAAGLAEG